MAVQQDLLFYSILLVSSCVYGFLSHVVNGLFWVLLGFLAFLMTGALGAAVAVDLNGDLNNVYRHSFFVSQTAGIDLIMTDLCMLAGVDKKLAFLNLVPPCLDLLMTYFVDSEWMLVTPVTHIVSIGLMLYFGIRDHKFALIVSAIGFLCGIFHLINTNERPSLTHLFNAVGVFFVGWSLAGKDLDDLGIPIKLIATSTT